MKTNKNTKGLDPSQNKPSQSRTRKPKGKQNQDNDSKQLRPLHELLEEVMARPDLPEYLFGGMMLLFDKMPVLPRHTAEEFRTRLDMHSHFTDGFVGVTFEEVTGLDRRGEVKA